MIENLSSGLGTINPIVCQHYPFPYACGIVQLQMNGYEMMARGQWNLFIATYGFGAIMTFIVSYTMIHLYQILLKIHFKKKHDAKNQQEIAELLPGGYR